MKCIDITKEGIDLLKMLSKTYLTHSIKIFSSELVESISYIK